VHAPETRLRVAAAAGRSYNRTKCQALACVGYYSIQVGRFAKARHLPCYQCALDIMAGRVFASALARTRGMMVCGAPRGLISLAVNTHLSPKDGPPRVITVVTTVTNDPQLERCEARTWQCSSSRSTAVTVARRHAAASERHSLRVVSLRNRTI
jgi:hypothetical protein